MGTFKRISDSPGNMHLHVTDILVFFKEIHGFAGAAAWV
jgi:hypothetical protein